MSGNTALWYVASGAVWKHAEELIKKALKHEEYKGYRLSVSENILRFEKDLVSLIKFKEPCEDILKGITNPELAVISVYHDGKKYDIKDKRIEQEQIHGDFPRMRYGWRKDSVQKTEPNLIFAGVNLNHSSYVNYHMHGGYEQALYSEDKSTLLGTEIPQTIKGATHLFGEEIPWNIDVRALESMLIETSGLKELTKD